MRRLIANQIKLLFESLVKNTADLKAILVTDRDGVILVKVQVPHLPPKVTKAALSATFSLCCDQTAKLGMGKPLMVMSAFDEYQIAQFSYYPLILSLISNTNSNTGRLIEIGNELQKEVEILAKKHSLIFCPDCGSLLEPPVAAETSVQCRLCSKLLPSANFDSIAVITKSAPGIFPEPPSQREKAAKEDRLAHLRDGATIKERCPKCDAPEMVFHTAQLRSADEGQTVFYTCIKCGFKEKLNS